MRNQRGDWFRWRRPIDASPPRSARHNPSDLPNWGRRRDKSRIRRRRAAGGGGGVGGGCCLRLALTPCEERSFITPLASRSGRASGGGARLKSVRIKDRRRSKDGKCEGKSLKSQKMIPDQHQEMSDSPSLPPAGGAAAPPRLPGTVWLLISSIISAICCRGRRESSSGFCTLSKF